MYSIYYKVLLSVRVSGVGFLQGDDRPDANRAFFYTYFLCFIIVLARLNYVGLTPGTVRDDTESLSFCELKRYDDVAAFLAENPNKIRP